MWRLLGVAGQRRADTLRERAAADALLRRARRRPLRQALCRRDSRRFARAWRDCARRDVRRPQARPAPRVRRLRPGGYSRASVAATTASSIPAFAASARPASRIAPVRSTARRGSRPPRSTSRRRARRQERSSGRKPRSERRTASRTRPVRDDAGRRPRLPRAAPLPQSAAASRLRTSQASRTSSSARAEAADGEPELVTVGEARVREEDLARAVDALEQPLVLLVRALAPEADEREVPRRASPPSPAPRAPNLRTAARAGGAREVAPAARCGRSSGGRPTASAPGIAGRAGSRPR